MKKILLASLLLSSLKSFASDVYVNGYIDSISTDYAVSKTSLVLKLKDSNYQGCENRFVLFHLSDFALSGVDMEDARDKLNFTRSIALTAMISNKKIEFILKSESSGRCTATGWIKILNN
ncbi:hypothetical protein [Pseudoalteromonas umbrosa]|uniref:hypothetical protein n=1 Tax=Pseudoalteromonas umbrosa TaxID=3048489 RepID=UPI0024C3CBEC|nr:hypothetical protein [Pseudoalteromonas sp. B95]MDK1287953.1 hypothetical protein [Pseudoalteromonas sp. B95]